MNAEGYTRCEQGHEHWGLAGAAGLFLVSDTRVLLQHRSPEVHEGDTWGIPGGALDLGESALTGAVREAEEELGQSLTDLTVIGEVRADHGGWSYTTVVARTPHSFDLPSADLGWETGAEGFRWVRLDEVPGLNLHGGLRASLPDLLALLS